MDDMTLRRFLSAAQGEPPPTGFVLDLRDELDDILDELASERSAVTPTHGVEPRAEVPPISLEPIALNARPLSTTRPTTRNLLVAAAALVLVVGLAIGFRSALRSDPSVVVATTDEIADDLIARSEQPDTSPSLRLILLAEAAAIDPRAETIARLGTELQAAGHLRVASTSVDGVHDVSISPDGRYAVIGRGFGVGTSPSFLVWDLDDGKTEPLKFNLDSALTTDFLPTGEIVAIGQDQADREAYRIGNTSQAIAVTHRDWASVDNRIGALVLSSDVFLLDIETGEELARSQVPIEPRTWRLNHDASIMIASQPQGVSLPARIIVWETATSSSFTSDHPLTDLGVTSALELAFSPDGALIATGIGDRIVIYDATTLAPISSFVAGESIRLVDFIDDGRTLMTMHGTETAKVRLWDVVTGQRLLADLDLHPESIDDHNSAANLDLTELSGDGTRLVTLSPDGTRIEAWAVDRHEWVRIACNSTSERIDIGDHPGLSSSACA